MEMKRRGEIKRRSKVPKIFFFCLTQKKRKLNQFKTFCTGSKHFVPVQNKIVPKIKLNSYYNIYPGIEALDHLQCNVTLKWVIINILIWRMEIWTTVAKYL